MRGICPLFFCLTLNSLLCIILVRLILLKEFLFTYRILNKDGGDMINDKDINITKNLKTIEWLKSELLMSIASLYELMSKGGENVKEDASDLISNIILISYLLGKRLGISYENIDLKVENKLKLGLVENHKIEKWYGDFSELIENFRLRKE
ncbi:MazG-like family protein [Sporanaerobacter sp. PP17-6a]|jgi:hypothetical protein|nr:MazG-like family protein [Sporanaerobacter sp. PP17-6a]